ncbi:MAG: glycosyltransferase family 39 protein [Anaerolineae bacterium]|nr:glycosyltransferase family 39 protein [Anaerolineae bacterium]
MPIPLIIITSSIILLYKLDLFPHPWFDEGYSTNAARTLVEQGVYGTYTSERLLPLDPGVSTGPTVILPLALSYAVLGPGIVQSRIVVVVFALIGVVILYRVAVYLYGPQAGLIAVMMAISFPTIDNISYLLLGRQVLGEVPGIALIMLGLLLWFHSWDRTQALWGFVAVVAMGLGIIAKIQLAIGIIPAIFLVILARQIKQPIPWIKAFTVLGISVGLVAMWMIFQRLGPPEALRAEFAATLTEAGKTHFLAPSFGRFLNRYGFMLSGVAGLAAATTAWRLIGHFRLTHRLDNPQWAELTFLLSVLISTGWFVILSIGWPRYMIFTLVISLLLLGRPLWEMLNRSIPLPIPYVTVGAALLLALFALGSNIRLIGVSVDDSGVTQMARYIDNQVPANAVIESWAWEIDALTTHREYHHPHQFDLYTAIQQQVQERQSFNIGYDMLKANPDYILTNEFSDCTQIYDPDILSSEFDCVAEFGLYSLYKKVPN